MKNSKIKIPRPQIREFCACIFYRLSHSVLGGKRQKCAAFCPLSFCRKSLTGSWRGPRGVATRPPPSCESGPAVEPGGPPGSAAGGKSDGDGSGMSGFQLRRAPELNFSSVKFRDIIVTRFHNQRPNKKLLQVQIQPDLNLIQVQSETKSQTAISAI